MKKLLVLLLAMGCSSHSGPVPTINSFTVDNPTPFAGDPVTFTYSVTGATAVAIYPIPGAVSSSPVTVVPPGSTTFTLRAFNAQGGSSSRDIAVTLRPSGPVAITRFDAFPGQVSPGSTVNLSWSTNNAVQLLLDDGSGSPPLDVTGTNAKAVAPSVTTIYTLTAVAKQGHTPASVSATAPARVAAIPKVTAFTATPASITQGDSVLLQWTGNAPDYAISDGTTTINVGAARSLTVRPSATVTYSLLARGPGGTLSPAPSATVSVAAHAATLLTYTNPTAGALRLVANPACSPCTAVTLQIVGSAPLRGFALDLPLDTTKVSFGSFSAPLASDASPAAGGAMGTGPLQNVLVLGAAREGNGTAPATDVTLPVIAQFTLTLQPAGGRGVIFDGATLAGNPAFKAIVQSAAGRAGGAIAVGKLEAN